MLVIEYQISYQQCSEVRLLAHKRHLLLHHKNSSVNSVQETIFISRIVGCP